MCLYRNARTRIRDAVPPLLHVVALALLTHQTDREVDALLIGDGGSQFLLAGCA